MMALLSELDIREQQAIHAQRGYYDEDGVLQGGLMSFFRYFWDVLEPGAELVEGWPLYAICEHLEAVTFGEINRLLINVSPGFSKTFLTTIFWPLWEWSAMGMPNHRFLTFSYSASLMQIANNKTMDVIRSPKFQAMYGTVFGMKQDGAKHIVNDRTGWKFATSVGGISTGMRGDRVICFPYETKVWTENGPRAIGQMVESRDESRVWSLNERTGAMELRPAIRWFKNPGKRMVRLRTGDGGVLECTYDHKIMTPDGYREAGQLIPGDNVLTAPRWMGVAPESEVARFSQSEMLPNVAVSNIADGALANSVFLSEQVAPLIAARENFPHDLLGEVAGSVPEIAVNFAVGDVLRARSVFDVVEAGDRSVPVLVPDLLSIGTRANERLGDHPVSKSIDSFPADSHRDTWVSLIEQRRHDFAGDRQLVAVSGDNARNTPHSAVAGDLVSARKSNNVAPILSVVVHVEFLHEIPSNTYCLTVEENHNLCCGEGELIICSNCDDPHNVKEIESEVVRTAATTWFRESMSNRVNNNKSAIVVIMQRLHDRDLSGVILELDLGYCHLMIPMEYDFKRQVLPDGSPVETDIGWIDPRYNPDDPESADGELCWPERFPPEQVLGFQKSLGLGYPGQYQQTPHPRGGNLFKREWWQPWDAPEFPQFEFLLGAVDTAFTENEMNDPTAMTVWGVFYADDGQPQVMLVDGWAKRLQMHGSLPLQAVHEKNVRGTPNPEYLQRCEGLLPREPGERDRVYYERIKSQWGVVEWIAHTARLRRVNRVIIENKTGGITAAQELRRIHGREGFAVDLVNIKGDKVPRALAVQPLFSQGLIFAPDRTYAEKVISEMEVFPKGRHDDLTDTATLALKWLRDNGFANRPEELRADEVDRKQLRKKNAPLYGLR